MNIKSVSFNKNVCFVLFLVFVGFVGFFICLCKSGLCSYIDCLVLTFGHSQNFLWILCIYVVRNMGHFTYSKCKVASLLWFAHLGMRMWKCSANRLFLSSGSYKHFA